MYRLRSSFINCDLLLFANRVLSWYRLGKNIRIILRRPKTIIYHDHLGSWHHRSCLNEGVCFKAGINNSWAWSLFEFIVNFIYFWGGLIFCFTFLSFLFDAAWFSGFWRRWFSLCVFRGVMKWKRVFLWFVIGIIVSLWLDSLLLLCWYVRLRTNCHIQMRNLFKSHTWSLWFWRVRIRHV